MQVYSTPLFLVIVVGPFTKWGVEFTMRHPILARGNKYIIMAIDYFTKCLESMPMFSNDSEIVVLFIFNQIITKFRALKSIFTDDGSHFQNQMILELEPKLAFKKGHSSHYYPQENGQEETINKSLKTILQRIFNVSKSN
jgi:hypothetical protein